MTTRWTFGIDWDRDGSYTDETARVLFAKWSLGFQQAHKVVGNDAQLRLILRNEDKRFTPENSAGPLSGKLAPLRPVKIESNDGTTTRRHFSGWVQSIHPAANHRGERTAAIRATGAMQFLKATETKIELQENQRSDQIIDALIQEVIFPPAPADAWVLGDPDYSKLGESTTLADLTAYSDFEEGVLTVQTPGETREVYVKYKDEKDKRIGGKDVTVEDVEYLQGSCKVEVEAKANGANLVIKNESDATEAVVEKCVVKGRNGRRHGIWSRRWRRCPGSWATRSAANWTRAPIWPIRNRIGEMRRFVTGRVSSHCFKILHDK